MPAHFLCCSAHLESRPDRCGDAGAGWGGATEGSAPKPGTPTGYPTSSRRIHRARAPAACLAFTFGASACAARYARRPSATPLCGHELPVTHAEAGTAAASAGSPRRCWMLRIVDIAIAPAHTVPSGGARHGICPRATLALRPHIDRLHTKCSVITGMRARTTHRRRYLGSRTRGNARLTIECAGRTFRRQRRAKHCSARRGLQTIGTSNRTCFTSTRQVGRRHRPSTRGSSTCLDRPAISVARPVSLVYSWRRFRTPPPQPKYLAGHPRSRRSSCGLNCAAHLLRDDRLTSNPWRRRCLPMGLRGVSSPAHRHRRSRDMPSPARGPHSS